MPSEPQPEPGPPETRTGAQLLRDGETLTADHVAAISAEIGKVIQREWEQFSTRRTADGGYVSVVDGREFNFSVNEDGDYVVPGPDHELATVWFRNDNPNGDKHFLVIGHDSESPRWRGYAIAGNRTFLDDSYSGTATYNDDGGARLELFQPEGDIWSRYRNTYWNNSVSLVVDFDAMTMSGRLDDWENSDGSVDLSATLGAAPITADGGFTGTFSVTGTELAGTLDASHKGSFYGPAAEDVAGVITGTYTASPGQSPGPVIGWFSARQAEQADEQQ